MNVEDKVGLLDMTPDEAREYLLTDDAVIFMGAHMALSPIAWHEGTETWWIVDEPTNGFFSHLSVAEALEWVRLYRQFEDYKVPHCGILVPLSDVSASFAHFTCPACGDTVDAY